MDWKDLLARKIEEGVLEIEDSDREIIASTPASGRSEDVLKVVTDRKGRKGKTATIVEGFTCDDNVLRELAGRLKTALGTGGSARGGEILIQGDCAEKVRRLLREMGYTVK